MMLKIYQDGQSVNVWPQGKFWRLSAANCGNDTCLCNWMPKRYIHLLQLLPGSQQQLLDLDTCKSLATAFATRMTQQIHTILFLNISQRRAGTLYIATLQDRGSSRITSCLFVERFRLGHVHATMCWRCGMILTLYMLMSSPPPTWAQVQHAAPFTYLVM